jgi:hypothetical protein
LSFHLAQHPPISRRNSVFFPIGRSPGSASSISYPFPFLKATVDLYKKSQLYSGGTALDFHQLPF